MTGTGAIRADLERDPRNPPAGDVIPGSWGLSMAAPGDLDELPRRMVLRARYGAEFGKTGGGECIAHIPRVRLSPGAHGERSITVHGDSWAQVLDELEDIIEPDPDG